MKFFELENGHGRVKCSEQGAHVCSWQHENIEQLFLSKHAIFDEGVAIRGGVPICFPQFGAFGPGVKHGFARNTPWETDAENHSNSNAHLAFKLVSDKQSLELWPFDFEARYEICLLPSGLRLEMKVINSGSKEFEFTSALHSYFRVLDVREISIGGLQHCEYWDNGTEFDVRNVEAANELRIQSAIDRVYFNSPNELSLIEGHHKRVISSQGFSDCVVWNPWLEGAQNLKDMEDNEYLNMICIESANVERAVLLKPGETWVGEQSISIV